MIPYSRQSITQDDINAVVNALKGDILTAGNLVDEFENALSSYVGTKHAVVLNSATSALHALYLAIGLKEGYEILTTPITFAATSNAALMTGANVRFADIKFNGNIDPEKVSKAITPQTKAIVGVDLGGTPIDIEPLYKIAKDNGIALLNDASHALGSSYGDEVATWARQNGLCQLTQNDKNPKVGSLALASVFSFHPIKPITTLEGGAVLTNDDDIADKVRLLRSHGITKRTAWDSQMSVLGYNYRLSDVACALGLSQLSRLDEMVKRRNEIASFYDKEFKNNPYFSTPKLKATEISSRHLYPILLHPHMHCAKQELYDRLKEQGIITQVHYKPTYKFDLYKEKYADIELKNAEEFYKSELSIPCHQAMSDEEAKLVSDTLLRLCKDLDTSGCKLR